jgi:hypothetical protein
MNRSLRKTAAGLFLLIAAVAPPCIAANRTVTRNAWNILSETQGKVTTMSMSVFGMKRYFDIEKEFIVDIDSDGNPVRGILKFVNGEERELKQQEALFFWDEFEGAHVLWQYLISKERIISINPQTSAVPLEAMGKQCRLVTENGREYFGKLNEIPSDSGWYAIQMPGWSMYVYKKNVRLIQQMK